MAAATALAADLPAVGQAGNVAQDRPEGRQPRLSAELVAAVTGEKVDDWFSTSAGSPLLAASIAVPSRKRTTLRAWIFMLSRRPR